MSDDCDYYDMSKDEEMEVSADAIGSCYDMQITHTIDCGITKQSCMDIEGVWYPEGHVSTYGDAPCCHCQTNCPAEGKNDDCNYYDTLEYMMGSKKDYTMKYCFETEDGVVPDSPRCVKFWTTTPKPEPVETEPDSGAFAMLGLAWLVF
jgi:hypothetical protein